MPRLVHRLRRPRREPSGPRGRWCGPRCGGSPGSAAFLRLRIPRPSLSAEGPGQERPDHGHGPAHVLEVYSRSGGATWKNAERPADPQECRFQIGKHERAGLERLACRTSRRDGRRERVGLVPEITDLVEQPESLRVVGHLGPGVDEHRGRLQHNLAPQVGQVGRGELVCAARVPVQLRISRRRLAGRRPHCTE